MPDFGSPVRLVRKAIGPGSKLGMVIAAAACLILLIMSIHVLAVKNGSNSGFDNVDVVINSETEADWAYAGFVFSILGVVGIVSTVLSMTVFREKQE